jgi:type II secretory pathway pseudopilin PulG
MPISFTCPHCGEKTLAPEQYAGHEGPCVNCGWVVTVPADAPRIDVVAPAERNVGESDRTKKLLVSIAVLALVGMIATVAVLLIGPAIRAGQTIATRQRCATNLSQLALALDAYHDANGSYPPAFVIGPDGKPWHSWRVLILPYLGAREKDLYRRYQMDQPWDSPVNRMILSSMPKVFASPADPTALPMFETSYVAVVGQGMVFQGANATSSAQIADGLEETLLLIENQATGIAWTEPRDLDGRKLTYWIGSDMGGNHPGGMLGVTADGRTHFIPDTRSPEEIHALLTIGGGEFVSVDQEE